MRKILSFICVVMLFTFCCACKAGKIKPITKNVSFTAHISYYNEKYVAPVTISNDGTLTLEIAEPDILAGVKYVFTRDGAKAQYNGITYTPSADNTQFFGVADAINSVFKQIDGVAAREDDGIYTIEGETQNGEFEIAFGKTGIPLNMELEGNISVRFADAKILNPTESDKKVE